jgi:hypothetical protein
MKSARGHPARPVAEAAGSRDQAPSAGYSIIFLIN